MNHFKKTLLALAALVVTAALAANVPIQNLPLGTAASSGSSDSFPYVDFGSNTTKRMQLWDLINLPPMQNTYAPLVNPGFIGNVSISTISTGLAVVTDGNRNLISGGATATEISYLQGLTGNVQDQLNSVSVNVDDFVLRAGDTMTGSLKVPYITTDTIVDTAGDYVIQIQEVGGGSRPILLIGSTSNVIDPSATASFVLGGTTAFPHSLGANSTLSVIGGGYDNHIGDDASASTIAGGAHHTISTSASHGAILGGSYQTISGAYAVAAGGTLNRAHSTYSFVGSGQSNVAGDITQASIDTRSAVVGGGAANEARALRSAVVGGNTNIIVGTATQGFIGGGANNTVSGVGASVVGGTNNTASGQTATVVGGVGNAASGLSSTAGGDSTTASANYAVALGEFLTASASVSMATGSRSAAVLRGQRAHAAGYFAAKGDAQMSDMVARVQTTTATPTNLDLNGGASTPMIIPDDTTWGFTVYVTARRTGGVAENAYFKLEGAIKRDSGAATTALVGVVTTTVIARDVPAWNVVATADTSNGALKLTATGEAAKTIRWVGRVQLTEVAE